MSSKYATLPDIDSAPDIYETPDTFPTSNTKDYESDEDGASTRLGRRKIDESAIRDDLDRSHLPEPAKVQDKFRRAERRRGRFREVYAYPASPSRSRSRSVSPGVQPLHRKDKGTPLSLRIQALKDELEALEQEASSTTDDTAGAVDIDPSGDLLRDLTNVRTRIGTLAITSAESRNRTLVERVVQSTKPLPVAASTTSEASAKEPEKLVSSEKPKSPEPEGDALAQLDRRLEELETLVGASSTTLDESSPLPQPLLPQITRLSNMLTLLTQPRHIDSVSRRLKLLLTDLERHVAAQAAASASNPTSTTSKRVTGSSSQPADAATSIPNLTLSSTQELAPILQRLSPALPTIPHLLTRLRTLSNLHASASGFATSLNDLEEEQKKTRVGLGELGMAVEALEKSFETNAQTVEGNLKGLSDRLDAVLGRLDTVGQ